MPCHAIASHGKTKQNVVALLTASTATATGTGTTLHPSLRVPSRSQIQILDRVPIRTPRQSAVPVCGGVRLIGSVPAGLVGLGARELEGEIELAHGK